MKTLTTLALTMALTGGAFSVQAAERSEQDLAACMAELQAYYGEGTELNLVDRRRNEHGTHMRVAAKLDADNAYFANCWVPKNDISGFDGGDVTNMVADTSAVAAGE